MDTRRFVVLAVCVAVYLAIGGTAMATTIPSGEVEYWPGHYLQYEPVETGFDVFGMNYQARTSGEVPWIHWALGPDGYPPYEGDDAAYYQRLRDEGYIPEAYTDEQAEEYMEDETGYWGARSYTLKLQWNEAYLSNQDGDDEDACLDWHPFTSPPHDMGGDFTGSGAACAGDWSVGAGQWAKQTYVAVPEDAYLEEKVVSSGGCTCLHWYVGYGDDRIEIGYLSGVALPGDPFCWATVQSLCYCPDQGGLPHCYCGDIDLGVIYSGSYQSPSVKGSYMSYGSE